ncbi:MAG TPA: serine/threonine-protein kinase [Blastocatellia bacterium]|nr:serine/threonine-protein kinase [Blastocatellia bacterium]
MATNWQIGDRIQNRWEIHKILRGGMGVVYIVYDHEHHNAYAAKTFQDEVFARSPLIAQRFTHEALTWVNLDVHQNVTRAHLVQNIEGKPYLFLEFVSGGDLSSWIGAPRLTQDLTQVLRFAIHFCDGMTHALLKGIKAHRDIKPSNCLITHDATLKVTDFGLSKLFDDTSPEVETRDVQGLSMAMTRTGSAAGTPPYMAPEQFDDAKRVDVRADIYSFGVMMYEMLTGRLPFVGRSKEELKRLHKQEQPPSLRKDWPEMSGIVERCLAKEAKDRYVGFEAVRKELGRIYETLTGERAPEAVKGRDLGAVEWANKGNSLSNLEKNEEAMQCFDRALEINPGYENAWYNKGVLLARLGRVEEAMACYDRGLKINPRSEMAWNNKGSALAELGRVEEAIMSYDRALEINPRHGGGWFNKGYALTQRARYEEAITCLDRALEINHRLGDAWIIKGDALHELGRVEESITCYDHALEISPRRAQVWINKGARLGELAQYEEAIACFDRGIEIDPGFETAWNNKGFALGKLGRAEEGIACYDRALEINPKFDMTWNNKGNVLGELGRLQEAVACYDRALKINPLFVDAWINKGARLDELGRFEDAMACYDRALGINPQSPNAWYNKGVALGRFGQDEKAMECFDRALEINPRYAEAWFNKAAALANSGRRAEALACFEQANRLGLPQAALIIAQLRQALGQR